MKPQKPSRFIQVAVFIPDTRNLDPKRASAQIRVQLLVLNGAADVHKGEAYLQEYQRVGAIVDAPDDPQHVTQEE